MSTDDTPRRAPQAWSDALAQARAERAAGQTLDLADMIAAYEREDEAELSAERAARARIKPRPAAKA